MHSQRVPKKKAVKWILLAVPTLQQTLWSAWTPPNPRLLCKSDRDGLIRSKRQVGLKPILVALYRCRYVGALQTWGVDTWKCYYFWNMAVSLFTRGIFRFSLQRTCTISVGLDKQNSALGVSKVSGYPTGLPQLWRSLLLSPKCCILEELRWSS